MGAKRTHSILFTLTILALAHGNSHVQSLIVDTGQSRCYDNHKQISCPRPGERFYGQDAQYDGLQMSYRDNGDGTITDLNTGLMWQKTPPAEHYTWDDAARYASDLELAGYDDWRMPTMKELYSLVDFSGTMRTMTPYINTEYFDFSYPDTSQGHRIMDAQYWSSNKYVGTTMRGEPMNAHGAGAQRSDPKAGDPAGYSRGLGPQGDEIRIYNYVRCVRDVNVPSSVCEKWHGHPARVFHWRGHTRTTTISEEPQCSCNTWAGCPCHDKTASHTRS